MFFFDSPTLDFIFILYLKYLFNKIKLIILGFVLPNKKF